MKKVLCMGLSFCLLFTGCGLLPEEEEMRTAPVIREISDDYFTTATVMTGDVIDYFTVQGKYQKEESQTLTLSSDGEELKNLYVAVGDKVKAGDVLAELTVGDLDQKLSDQQALCDEYLKTQEYYESLVAVEEEREKLAKQYGKEYDDSVLTDRKQKLEDASDKYYIADVKLGEIEEQLNKKRLVSGITGVITEVEYLHGWDWGKNTGVKISVESESYGFVFTTDEVDSFPIGAVCEVDLQNGSVINAEVVKAVATNDAGTMVKVTMEPLSDTDAPISGMTGTIKVVKQEVDNVTYVPAGALRKIGEEYAVYVVNADGMRERRIVEIGLKATGNATSDDNRVEIISGVTAGEEVIIR